MQQRRLAVVKTERRADAVTSTPLATFAFSAKLKNGRLLLDLAQAVKITDAEVEAIKHIAKGADIPTVASAPSVGSVIVFDSTHATVVWLCPFHCDLNRAWTVSPRDQQSGTMLMMVACKSPLFR